MTHDIHNIRPAGQMWPAESFYMARNCLQYQIDCLIETHFEQGKNMIVKALKDSKKIFLARHKI